MLYKQGNYFRVLCINHDIVFQLEYHMGWSLADRDLHRQWF